MGVLLVEFPFAADAIGQSLDSRYSLFKPHLLPAEVRLDEFHFFLSPLTEPGMHIPVRIQTEHGLPQPLDLLGKRGGIQARAFIAI